jgi:signal transduction histidine kinase
MTETIDTAATRGLRFFGRMSASISHDLKNTLSIMNESAGLLEDLALLAERGRPLDPSRIKQLGATIKRQIQRTDGIVRNMNRFAHAVDDPVKEIDLAAALEMLLSICRRLTDARGLSVAIAPGCPQIPVLTRPFYFYHLIWLLLEWCMQSARPPGGLELDIEERPGSVVLRFKRTAVSSPEVWKDFPSGEMNDLLALLDARLEITKDQPAVAAFLPRKIGA